MRKNVETFFALMLVLMIGLFLLQVSGASSALYSRLSEQKSDQDQVKIAAAYLITKLKQSDRSGALGIVDGRLVVDEGFGFHTYVYLTDGRLVESTLTEGIEPDIGNSFEIARLDRLEFEIDGRRIYLCVSKGDRTIETAVRLRSENALGLGTVPGTAEGGSR